jgi:hypothetical protein
MNEPTGHDRVETTVHLTPGAITQVREFGEAANIPTFTEALEGMIALAALHNFPTRIREAIRAQERKGYKR